MEKGKVTWETIFAAFTGVLLVGIGVAFNNCAGLGNDPVGMVYDGIRSAGNMNQEQLGMASNMVNLALAVLLFFIGRRYIRVGTFVYFLPYGLCVDLGNYLYRHLAFSDGLASRILFSTAGCLLLCLGVSIYITVDIGVDPFTGVVLVIRDRLQKEYRLIKVTFDIAMIVLGTILGGKLGIVTIITALLVGPVIQWFIVLLNKYWLKG